MDTSNLLIKFARIGARLKVADRPSRRFRTASGVVSLDVSEDREGEFFVVARRSETDPDVAVLDVQPTKRHLLLLVSDGDEKQKFLCGHDERHWFVAAVPSPAPVGTVRQAKEALKPTEVQTAQGRQGLRAEACNRRKNAAYRRQGEWFFLPVPGFHVDESLVLRDEPLRRGNGKPHWIELCYRTEGETVYVCPPPPQRCNSECVPADSHRQPSERRRGGGSRCCEMRASTSGEGSGTPTTRRSCSTDGTGC